MKEVDHLKAYEEYKDNIFSWALEIRGLEKSQRTVALNASRAMLNSSPHTPPSNISPRIIPFGPKSAI